MEERHHGEEAKRWARYMKYVILKPQGVECGGGRFDNDSAPLGESKTNVISNRVARFHTDKQQRSEELEL